MTEELSITAKTERTWGREAAYTYLFTHPCYRTIRPHKFPLKIYFMPYFFMGLSTVKLETY